MADINLGKMEARSAGTGKTYRGHAEDTRGQPEGLAEGDDINPGSSRELDAGCCRAFPQHRYVPAVLSLLQL